MIDETLITDAALTLLPQDYYSVDNASQFLIQPGTFQGSVEITIKPAFYADPKAITGNYVLPFKLVSTSLDSILGGRETLLLKLKYEAEVFGNYYHNGVTEIKDASGNLIDTQRYHQEEPITNAVNNWALTTTGANTVTTNGIGYLLNGSTKQLMEINVDASHKVSVSSNAGSTIEITESGTCSYDAGKRILYLEYKFTNANGNLCNTKDTLTFRNRILDGVNQWRGF